MHDFGVGEVFGTCARCRWSWELHEAGKPQDDRTHPKAIADHCPRISAAQRNIMSSKIIFLLILGFGIGIMVTVADGLPARCVPGRQEGCVCAPANGPRLYDGAQVCAKDGRRYETCVCKEVKP